MSSTATRFRGAGRPTSGGPHFEAFCREYCIHTKGSLRGEPLLFEPWQRRAWKEALRLDRRGRRVYQFVLFGRPRKNYKTTECAALGLYLAGPEGEPGPEVAIGSGSKDQAGLVFNQARQFVEQSAELQRVFRPQTDVIVSPSFGGLLQRVSSEGRLQMGLNLSGVILDELHVFKTSNERMLYSALVTASAIREEPFIAAITTAGWDKHSLLGEVYSHALELDDVAQYGRYKELTIAKDESAGFLMLWYGAPEGSDVENRNLWRAVNPGKQVRMAFLDRQWRSPALSEGEFRRYHLNQWTATVERWIADHIWRLGATDLDPRGTELAGQPAYLAVDAALTYDTTAVCVATPIPDDPQDRIFHEAKVWSARPEVAHDVFVPGGRIDNALVEDWILNDVAKRRQIKELVYDPRYFEDAALRLSRKGLIVAPMTQGSNVMREATDRFYVDCQEEKVAYRGGEAATVLTQHVEAAAAVKTEAGWRVSKLRSSRPIDALIAMVMAHSRAVRRSKSVYETRGLLTIGDTDDDE